MPGKHKARNPNSAAIGMPPPGIPSQQTQLNNSIQKILRRDLEKKEIVFDVVKETGGVRASVTTPAMSRTYGQKVHTGDIKTTHADAKESAASTALQSILSNRELLAIHDEPKLVRDVPPSDPNGPREKHKLRNTILKIIRTNLKKEDMVWTTTRQGRGFVSVVTLPCLPGNWKTKKWTGAVCNDENTAEHSAAGVALEKIMADAELRSLHDNKFRKKT
eukprot:gnl/MRDRNA2_/MRDRNA2_119920_c0_seq1.p1 gnl/MRDRNA2_/MRDRNA2_119920_c0~~gnl/MRDRNA2_/MRDRNA2_119920_c0_seq1.p1  ORF type:complete len:219 (+),score=52.45 gnl/MRDRNA2_/MRDRNA2_119920_c0_seq1:135-791(+)